MKFMHFRNLFFSLALIFSAVVIAYDVEGLRYIECELKLRERSSRRHEYNNFKLMDDKSSYASFTHPHIPVQEGTSQNWSGYAALTNLNYPQAGSVDAVYGSWICPKLSAATDNTYCSLWIGIDGYGSNSVEQLGTEHDWYNGVQSNYAWFEMYPNASYEISGFPANPGDSISASVVYQGNGIFVLSIANITRGVHTTIPTAYTISLTAQRVSAEWVLEAPYYNGILPLSHFGVAYFSNCTATINNIHGAINNSNWADDALIMVTGTGAVKAVPTVLMSNGQAFDVVWQHE